MSGIQSRRLASTIFGIDDQEMAFNELVQDIVGQHNTGATHSVVRFQPQLRFVRDASTNVILHRALPVVLDGSLVTKEIVGGIQFAAFPIPLRVVVSSRSTPVQVQVEVSAPTSIALKLSSDAMPRDALVEVTTYENCTLNLAVRTTAKGAAEPTEETSTDDTQQLALACHSLPLLVYFVCQPFLLSHRDALAAPAAATSHRHHADTVTMDSDDGGGGDGNDDMGAGMSLDDGNDIVLDDDSFF
ncbi:hypothetical protein DYB32_004826 [Aphanomyces invadans]|uniref:Uncharacterized protein n=1 Tax=Aphanomyces invadans TaxID=157072 RepID=A0A3R6Y933_9STRA|nr:hypothetical protein DYB32_004826 [Aphanomyces invadans]